jgi:hypothetical protein
VISPEDLHKQTAAETERLLAELGQQSEQELMDQVYRRLTIHLCGRCYPKWIENPAGDGAAAP